MDLTARDAGCSSDTMDTNEASSAIVYPNVAANASGHAPKASGASIYGNPVNSSLFYGRVYVLHTNQALMGRVNTESGPPESPEGA